MSRMLCYVMFNFASRTHWNYKCIVNFKIETDWHSTYTNITVRRTGRNWGGPISDCWPPVPFPESVHAISCWYGKPKLHLASGPDAGRTNRRHPIYWGQKLVRSSNAVAPACMQANIQGDPDKFPIFESPVACAILKLSTSNFQST